MQERRRPRASGCRKWFFGCAGALLLAIAGVIGLFLWSQSRVVPESLAAIGLAPIPREARDVHAAGWANLFSAETRVRFQASPDVIQRYLADSPALHKLQPERFSPKHCLLPVAEKEQLAAKDWEAAQADAAYYPSRTAPWYTPRITTAGRRWELPWDKDQLHGEVIVDEVAGLVYITVDRS